MRDLWRRVRGRLPGSRGSKQRWLASIAIAAAVGLVCFLAARLSLFLLTQPDGVSVFWLGAGVSSGALIALGHKARWPVAVGVMAATIAANLTSDRSILAAVVFALCDAGEALLVAWLTERFIGAQFRLDKVRHVLWLLLAAIIGTAISGVGGALGDRMFYHPTAPVMLAWWHWFSSTANGIITTAPLIIGIASLVRAPPSRREIMEGSAALVAVVAVMGTIIFLLPRSWWDRIAPVELLLPLLLWTSARCRPAVTAAAVFIISLTIVGAFIFGLGHFGDIGPSMEQRTFAIQAAVLGVAIFSYVLTALFAERRQQAAEVQESESRMRAIVKTVVDGIVIIDYQGTVENLNPAAEQAFGYDPEEVIGRNVRTLMPQLDTRALDAGLAGRMENGHGRASGVRREMPGVRKNGSVFPMELAVGEMRVAGKRMFTLVVRDITERKLAEQNQTILTSELQHRTNNLLTVVQIITNRTLSGGDPLKQKEVLEARLRALARANRQLTESNWSGLTLDDIIQSELEPYLARCDIDGIDIVLDRQYAQNFSLVMHELATNAIKYGALSNLEGRVRINWGIEGAGPDSQLAFRWSEQGGPPVVAPKRQGFGSKLLTTTFSNARFNFEASGFSCEIEVPLGEVASPDPRQSLKPAWGSRDRVN